MLWCDEFSKVLYPKYYLTIPDIHNLPMLLLTALPNTLSSIMSGTLIIICMLFPIPSLDDDTYVIVIYINQKLNSFLVIILFFSSSKFKFIFAISWSIS
jgi:hypothetical protein